MKFAVLALVILALGIVVGFAPLTPAPPRRTISQRLLAHNRPA